ncbi:unnamed protein product [Echinostoma caproni]|uniref:MOR2-PAG1_C domain-containing protein n=1 Tax=Echinostoma caproni TaxID=27848 RepID=A0A183B860_9TREM|nr:unnamed protein product [Echinostoma caproni]
MLLHRLHLPTHILTLNDPVAVDVDLSDQSVLLDTSIGQGRPNLGDITLNSTLVQNISPRPSNSSPSIEGNHPTEDDFVISELILRDATVRRILLPNLCTFIFTGDPNWCAVQCVLRTQLGFLLWPQLSLADLYASLLRLNFLAECKNSTHQRLIMDCSQTQASSDGGTFTAISMSRLPACLQQLVSLDNDLQTCELSWQLIIDFQLIESIDNKLFAMIHKNMTKHTTAYLVRVTEQLLCTDALWKCVSRSASGSVTCGVWNPERFVSDLLHRLLTGATCLTAGPPGQLFSRILSVLINWPLPDPVFERAVVHWVPLIIAAIRQTPQNRSPDSIVFRIWLVVQILRLLSTCCSTELATSTLSECFHQMSNHFPYENLTSQAVNASAFQFTPFGLNDSP